jgi:TetR/AcrR family transcriptional regulator
MVKIKSVVRKTPPRDTDTEARILDAAHIVFVRRGTAGARMQDIADEAGVNKALLHYYFRSKSRLAAAVFQRVARGLFLRVSEILGSDAAIEDKVRRVVHLYLEQLMKTPYAPAYVISELNQHPDRAAQFVEAVRHIREQSLSTDVLDTLGKQLRRGVRAGEMRVISTPQFIANLASLCIFPFAARPMLCAILDLDDRGFARFIEERKTVLPEFFLNALRP